jgi:hypothetical protein
VMVRANANTHFDDNTVAVCRNGLDMRCILPIVRGLQHRRTVIVAGVVTISRDNVGGQNVE